MMKEVVSTDGSELMALLGDPDPLTRYQAFNELGKLRYLPAVPALIELLPPKNEPLSADVERDVERFHQALQALSETRSFWKGLWLTYRLRHSFPPQAGWRDAEFAILTLGEIGDVRAVEPLLALLDDPFLGGRAVEALEKIHDERAIEPLIALFERARSSPGFFKPEHSPSLATVLGNWGDRRAVGPLIEAMDDSNPHVRFYVARALGKLGDERALPVLRRAVEQDTQPITDTASIRGKSVSYVAARAIEKINAGKGERAT